jgi:hypothetical protein
LILRFIFGIELYMFRTVCPSSGVQYCTHNNRYMSYRLCWLLASGIRIELQFHPDPADDGQRNCPKHVEFYCKNKLEKLVHLVGFIIRIYHDDARSSECQIRLFLSCSLFAIFFPAVRNDVLLVIQDLGRRSVTSDFHSRSQTIPCEIVRDVTVRDFVLGTLRFSPVPIPQQIHGTHWFIHHRRSINIANDSVVKQNYPLFLSHAKIDICVCVLENGFLLFSFTMVQQPDIGPRKLSFRFRDT